MSMLVENIHQSLKALGYYAPYNDRSLVVARKPSDRDPGTIEFEDVFCRIIHDLDPWVVICGRGPIPDIKHFDKEEEIVAFIKKEYPL